MFRHCCFFLFRSRSAFASQTRSSDVRFDLSSSSGETVTRRVSRMIRNLMRAPAIGQVTAILPLRSWCMAAPESPASLTGRLVMPAPQSNLIAPWLRKVIQQTMVANARARPTSGQTRSNAVNTTPHVFVAPLRGMLAITPLVRSCGFSP
jgi:hypothetical protein